MVLSVSSEAPEHSWMKPSKNLLLTSSMISLLCSLTCALGPLSQSTIPNFQLLTKHDSSSLSASSKIQVSPIYSLSLVFTFFFFENRVLLCSSDWPWVCYLLAHRWAQLLQLLPNSWFCCHSLLVLFVVFALTYESTMSELWQEAGRDCSEFLHCPCEGTPYLSGFHMSFVSAYLGSRALAPCLGPCESQAVSLLGSSFS